MKLLAYRVFDPAGTKANAKRGAPREAKPEETTAPRPEAKDQTVADLSGQIAKRAYELYEEGGRKDGAAVRNWEKAEAEIRKEAR